MDTFVKLVESHRILQQSPSELGFVVDERDLLLSHSLSSYMHSKRDRSVHQTKGARADGRRNVPDSGESFRVKVSVDCDSFSSKEGAIVRKSQPANSVISDVCRKEEERSQQQVSADGRRKESRGSEKTMAHASEGSTHNNCLVAMGLVVVVNGRYRDDTGVSRTFVRSVRLVLLVPIQDPSDER